jgi:hypothetical protein
MFDYANCPPWRGFNSPGASDRWLLAGDSRLAEDLSCFVSRGPVDILK